jgi:hypothetical protein
MACTNKIKCPCTFKDCDKHGKCCECIDFHRKCKELPACYFSKEDEKTYDRSIKFYLKTN